jgi:hypothetical protein
LLDLGDTLYGPLDPRGTWELLNSPGLPAVHVMGNQDRDLFDPASDPALNPSLPYARSQLGAERWPGCERAIEVELVSLEYDWNDAARTAEKNGRPDWAHALRTGFAG